MRNYSPKILMLILGLCSQVMVAQTPEEAKINTLMDQWHQAAATADEEVFFGSMTDDAIYIGTDAGERWYRDELKKWSASYFERESAWSFEPIERKVYLKEGASTAWFDETLKTWMGVCRSSGVVVLTSDGWKIQHYHLSVTISNDLIKPFIELIKEDSINSFLNEE